MAWLFFAFSGPVLWAISFHLDKYLVDRYFQQTDLAVFMVFTALIGALMLPFILYWQPNATALPRVTIFLLVVAGIGSMGAMIFYLRALRKEDIAIVAPLFQLAPIFVFILGYVALGEVPSYRQATGAALIMLGAGTLSWSGRRSGFKLPLVVLMALCTATLAATTVLFKIAAVRGGYWPATFWMYVGEAVFGLVIVLVPSYRRQIRSLLRDHPGAIVVLNGTNELINLAGALGTRYALLLAPMGLVQAIGSTTSMFVFIFSLMLPLLGQSATFASLSQAACIRTGVGAMLVTIGTALCLTGTA